jgi:hypothetical protein
MLTSRNPGVSLRSAIIPIALAGIVGLTACTGSQGPAPSTGGAPTRAAVSGATPAAGSASSPVALQKVNANTASQDEVARVLEADGVPNASRWAREVVEYRPYPTDDPSFGKLRQELAKYNPGPQVTDQIVAALTL